MAMKMTPVMHLEFEVDIENLKSGKAVLTKYPPAGMDEFQPVVMEFENLTEALMHIHQGLSRILFKDVIEEAMLAMHEPKGKGH